MHRPGKLTIDATGRTGRTAEGVLEMKVRNRLGLGIATVAIGVVGALGLAACGSTPAASTSMSAEATALTALGFSNSDVSTVADGTDATSAPDSTATPKAGAGKGRRHPLLRRLAIRSGLAKRVQHGEITVSTKNGEKVIEVQRGTVTDITDTTVTVKCTDGFSMTWTFGDPIHVIEHRTTVQPTDLQPGEVIGVAGTKDGDTNTARLIVVPNASKAGSGG